METQAASTSSASKTCSYGVLEAWRLPPPRQKKLGTVPSGQQELLHLEFDLTVQIWNGFRPCLHLLTLPLHKLWVAPPSLHSLTTTPEWIDKWWNKTWLVDSCQYWTRDHLPLWQAFTGNKVIEKVLQQRWFWLLKFPPKCCGQGRCNNLDQSKWLASNWSERHHELYWPRGIHCLDYNWLRRVGGRSCFPTGGQSWQRWLPQVRLMRQTKLTKFWESLATQNGWFTTTLCLLYLLRCKTSSWSNESSCCCMLNLWDDKSKTEQNVELELWSSTSLLVSRIVTDGISPKSLEVNKSMSHCQPPSFAMSNSRWKTFLPQWWNWGRLDWEEYLPNGLEQWIGSQRLYCCPIFEEIQVLNC